MPAPQFVILIVDDEPAIRETLAQVFMISGYAVETAADGAAAINLLQTRTVDLALLDIHMPRITGIEVLRHIKEQYFDLQTIMFTGVDDVPTAVECMQLGAYTYVTKPLDPQELLTLVERALERKRLMVENKALRSELARHASESRLIGTSDAFMSVVSLAARVAASDSAVLIQGASGTGKELIASFLHKNSPRKDSQFVALNCASIPETLIESELFGHEKGAFTDAQAMKQGLVEIASGGTLFLDEVGEISLMMQPKLLRFLQTGEYRRVGSNKVMVADVRVISATNRDLRQEVAEKRFREDLMFRLNVITLQLPKLSERKDDIPLLTKHFLQTRLKIRRDIDIDQRAMDLLQKYDWPGNVRELENVIERAAILCKDNVIRIEDLALPLGAMAAAGEMAPGGGGKLGTAVSLRDIERDHIDGVLKTVGWNKNLAAKILGISLKTLYTKIQQYNLSKE